MHFDKSPRMLAAFSFIWPTLMSIGLLAVLGIQFGSVSGLFSLEPPADSIVRFAYVTLILALACGGILLSRVCLPQISRVFILFVCIAIALACLGSAQILVLGWVFPCWYVFRFARATNA